MKLAEEEQEERPKGRRLLDYEQARGFGKSLFGLAMPVVWTLPTAAGALKTVKRIRRALDDVADELERVIDSEWPNTLGEHNKQVDLEGVGRVTRHRGSSRKGWDREGVTRVVVARALDERQVDGDGEPMESEGACMARVLSSCFRFEARATELKRRGVDPDEFSTTTDGKLSIDIFDAEG